MAHLLRDAERRGQKLPIFFNSSSPSNDANGMAALNRLLPIAHSLKTAFHKLDINSDEIALLAAIYLMRQGNSAAYQTTKHSSILDLLYCRYSGCIKGGCFDYGAQPGARRRGVESATNVKAQDSPIW